MDLRAHHVGIVVADLERSKRFYAALGFEQDVEHVMEDKTISFMKLGDFQVELFAYREPMPVAELPDRARGFRHLAFETDDIDASLAALQQAGVVGAEATVRVLPAGWRLLFFNDPDGIEIEIKQA